VHRWCFEALVAFPLLMHRADIPSSGLVPTFQSYFVYESSSTSPDASDPSGYTNCGWAI
jgi:hypothetical protein